MNYLKDLGSKKSRNSLKKAKFQMKHLYLPLIGITFSFYLSGCTNHLLDDMGLYDQTVNEPTYPINSPQQKRAPGTIYRSNQSLSLYEDHIAHRVGDMITVVLEESTQGKKKTKTKANKTATNNFTTPTIFGGTVKGLSMNTSTDQEFEGEGEMNQQNSLSGNVSVTVMQVLSNGNLVIKGESWLTINEGREYIRLTGIIRREDISQDNTISSQRVANARITYSGNGLVANSSRGGMLTQLLAKFFPY